MNKLIYIIHGWTGTPKKDWLPWIKIQLENKGFEVIAPVMPDTNHPTKEKWVGHLIKTVKKPNTHSFLVGHSLGCITILRFLQTLSPAEKVGGVLLVAGFGYDLSYKGYHHELKSFFDEPVQWDKIRSQANKFVSIHSANDPFIPINQSSLFREKLKAETYIEPNMFHYHEEAGIDKAPLVLEKLLGMIR